MRLSHLPLRVSTGAFILNAGLSKRPATTANCGDSCRDRAISSSFSGRDFSRSTGEPTTPPVSPRPHPGDISPPHLDVCNGAIVGSFGGCGRRVNRVGFAA